MYEVAIRLITKILSPFSTSPTFEYISNLESENISNTYSGNFVAEIIEEQNTRAAAETQGSKLALIGNR